jgi:hypothetical protein
MSLETTEIKPEVFQTKEKQRFSEKAEAAIDKYTPQFLKRFCNWVLELLPERTSNWIRDHRFLTICIIYTVRGLFLRPSMWLVYMAVWAYFMN